MDYINPWIKGLPKPQFARSRAASRLSHQLHVSEQWAGQSHPCRSELLQGCSGIRRPPGVNWSPRPRCARHYQNAAPCVFFCWILMCLFRGAGPGCVRFIPTEQIGTAFLKRGLNLLYLVLVDATDLPWLPSSARSRTSLLQESDFLIFRIPYANILFSLFLAVVYSVWNLLLLEFLYSFSFHLN